MQIHNWTEGWIVLKTNLAAVGEIKFLLLPGIEHSLVLQLLAYMLK
jgi:hypothetical protein